jgi:nucleoside-diphosphate-sugar epimerase
VFTSSVAVFGHTQTQPPPRTAADPVSPVDLYAQTKVECEDLVRRSGIDWVILRVCAAPPQRPGAIDRRIVEEFFRVRPECRIEFVHPADAGLAHARAATTPAVTGRTLLIGGGPACRTRAAGSLNAMLGTVGLRPLPSEVFGDREIYSDWVDTEESQRLLGFQRFSFVDVLADLRAGLPWWTGGLRPFAPMLRRLLIRRFRDRGDHVSALGRIDDRTRP